MRDHRPSAALCPLSAENAHKYAEGALLSGRSPACCRPPALASLASILCGPGRLSP